MQYKHHVDTWLSVRMINYLQAEGYDLTEPTPALEQLVDTNEWKHFHNLGPKSRDEIAEAIRQAHAHKLETIEQAVVLLEENGYSVIPVPT